MGKNHRHKKTLKSEKAKIKMKVKSEKTKFLPKGLNETKTDFKIKPIILPQQLREKNSLDLLSARKLNVKDILSRFQHHNSTVRRDCLNDLKQMISSHLDVLVSQHLAQIMHGLPPLLLDEERTVRQSVMASLNKILDEVNEEKISPFFGILSSYLRCSMTNINRAVQEDSLGFLAILLQHIPKMIVNERQKILPNLFALISKFKSEAKPVRTLSVNLNRKQTSVKWHIQVLSGIYGFLKAIDNDYENKQSQNRNLSEFSSKFSMHQAAVRHVPLIHNAYLNSTISFNNDLMNYNAKDEVIEKNMHTLITLLYEIWMEAAPEKDIREFSDFALLNNDSSAILSCVLNVLHLLLVRLIQMNEGDLHQLHANFFTTECKNLLQNIMSSFPYTKNQDRAKVEKTTIQKLLNKHVDADPKFVRENLIVCYLFCNLNKRLVLNQIINDAQRVLNYIEHCLITRGCINNTNLDSLLLVIRAVFFENFEWHRKVDIANILTRFVNFYENQCVPLGDKRNNDEILDILCELSQLSHLSKNNVYQNWLGNLSSSLGEKKVNENVIDALLLVGKQRNAEFLTGLRQRMNIILENYKNIEVTNMQVNNQNIAKLKILCLFYYLPDLEKQEVSVLKTFQLDSSLKEQEKSIIEYLLKNY